MSEEELSEYAKKFLLQINNQNGFENFSMSGDGFSSEMLSVAVTDSVQHKQLHIVCKIGPCDEAPRERRLTSVTFNREELSYNKIFPIFTKFQK